MHRILTFALVFTLSGFLLSSCSNHDEVIKTSSEIQKKISLIGRQHNDCLSKIFNELNNTSKTKSVTDLNREEITDLIVNIASDYAALEYDLEPLTKNAVKESITIDLQMTEKQLEKVCYEHLDNIQRTLFSELEFIVSNDNEDIISLISKINDVENKAQQLLTGEKMNTILVACAVAKNSVEYWSENAKDWGLLMSHATKKKNFSWKELLKADLRGAVVAGIESGAIKLAKLGGPIGWKAWAAITLGGAVGFSADNAITQLW